jgi:hypothetical protein
MYSSNMLRDLGIERITCRDDHMGEDGCVLQPTADTLAALRVPPPNNGEIATNLVAAHTVIHETILQEKNLHEDEISSLGAGKRGAKTIGEKKDFSKEVQ